MSDWKRKVTSRKFIMSVAAFVVGCMLLFDADANTVERVSGLFAIIADVIGYLIVEGGVDAANKPDTE